MPGRQNRAYLFLMLGFPGSGKSYVAEWLAPKMAAVHLRSDDLRLAMFGPDRPELHRDRKYLLPVIGAMEYMAAQSLAAGHSVVQDANLNRRATRRALNQMAVGHNALAVTVWVNAPIDIAKERVVERERQGGHQIFGDTSFVERMAKAIEPPTEKERVIKIDGTIPAAEQVASFDRQLAHLERSAF